MIFLFSALYGFSEEIIKLLVFVILQAEEAQPITFRYWSWLHFARLCMCVEGIF